MTDASWIERSVLIALMAASLALFWLRFRKVLEAIRGSRATPDFEVAPLGPRIRQFLWEVVAQGKVIGQRPLPGLAHAFVFWGFCAFALVTVNHFASGVRRALSLRRNRLWKVLSRVRSGVGRGRGGGHRRPVHPPLLRAPGVARGVVAGIGRRSRC